jgi:transcriptional regulator with XRE-family HTH domain
MRRADRKYPTRTGEIILKRRLELGISSRKLAQKSGVNLSSVSQLENGIMSNPSFLTIMRIAKALKMDIRSFKRAIINDDRERKTEALNAYFRT